MVRPAHAGRQLELGRVDDRLCCWRSWGHAAYDVAAEEAFVGWVFDERPRWMTLWRCSDGHHWALTDAYDGAWIMRRCTHSGDGGDHDPALVQLDI
jgi:hypothetical protein